MDWLNVNIPNCGTLGFIDPALSNGSTQFNYSCDIYSFGKTVMQFILGKKFNPSYYDSDLEEMIKEAGISINLSSLIHRMIDPDLLERIQLEMVLEIARENLQPKKQFRPQSIGVMVESPSAKSQFRPINKFRNHQVQILNLVFFIVLPMFQIIVVCIRT
ncbi:predicted protein [Naegleria gruberi]|uniref:Predicted protein n=1 Tax=Naegleria gruberi TaxID=5762 RepID=D2VBN1_NAEGR|nr:uncharacterized protein NAEGRDRAFT_66274 [Naegleria gruberi]EFC45826.1 predicted protein [Naegleria gruberi]|eukprot:XP_002678570.1 predicted protein [Naegleria gruberi strain NEG-M]